MSAGSPIQDGLEKSATRDFPEVAALVRSLKPGELIRVSRALRINSSHSWPFSVEGKFVQANHLRTGLATDRAIEDDIVLLCVHIEKPNGEKANITVDEFTTIQKL
ncbi:MAG: hypothetical protein LW700_01550 [Gemmataceae bacterium]|nr:hypothetical protein [Gemmataceae bacterium]